MSPRDGTNKGEPGSSQTSSIRTILPLRSRFDIDNDQRSNNAELHKMVRLKLNPPKAIEGSHIHVKTSQTTALANARTKRQVKQKIIIKLPNNQSSSKIPAEDQEMIKLSEVKNGASKKRKLDVDVPSSSDTPHKKAKSNPERHYRRMIF